MWELISLADNWRKEVEQLRQTHSHTEAMGRFGRIWAAGSSLAVACAWASGVIALERTGNSSGEAQVTLAECNCNPSLTGAVAVLFKWRSQVPRSQAVHTRKFNLILPDSCLHSWLKGTETLPALLVCSSLLLLPLSFCFTRQSDEWVHCAISHKPHSYHSPLKWKQVDHLLQDNNLPRTHICRDTFTNGYLDGTVASADDYDGLFIVTMTSVTEFSSIKVKLICVTLLNRVDTRTRTRGKLTTGDPKDGQLPLGIRNSRPPLKNVRGFKALPVLHIALVLLKLVNTIFYTHALT